MCYSTCTLNPIEDEAVVAAILRHCKGAVELVDCSESVPGLVRRPGISTWQFFEEGPKVHKGAAKKEEEAPAAAAAAEGAVAEGAAAEGEAAEGAGTKLSGSIRQQAAAAAAAEADGASEADSVPKTTEELIEEAKAAGLRHYPTFEDVPASFHGRVKVEMFPPSAEEAAEMHLERYDYVYVCVCVCICVCVCVCVCGSCFQTG